MPSKITYLFGAGASWRIENSEELGIQGLPTTFIFNAEGKLGFSEIGYRKWDEKNNMDMLIKIANTND